MQRPQSSVPKQWAIFQICDVELHPGYQPLWSPLDLCSHGAQTVILNQTYRNLISTRFIKKQPHFTFKIPQTVYHRLSYQWSSHPLFVGGVVISCFNWCFWFVSLDHVNDWICYTEEPQWKKIYSQGDHWFILFEDRFLYLLVGLLLGWLIDWSIDWLIDWLWCWLNVPLMTPLPFHSLVSHNTSTVPITMAGRWL